MKKLLFRATTMLATSVSCVIPLASIEAQTSNKSGMAPTTAFDRASADAPPLVSSTTLPRLGEKFPWKERIVTTTFWVGEAPTKNNPTPNHMSSWDKSWASNFGGTDDPDPAKRATYLPAKFVPRQNPFYVALPYNDLMKGGHKPEAAQVIPWFKADLERPGKTVLKGRWIAIRFQGRTAYAQWEDCGPFRTDHWQYVFGNERPKSNLNRGAGLDVSPAVRDYLGMASTDVTDWRFVEFDEVPHGPWATHGDNNTFVINQRKSDDATATVKAETPQSPTENDKAR